MPGATDVEEERDIAGRAVQREHLHANAGHRMRQPVGVRCKTEGESTRYAMRATAVVHVRYDATRDFLELTQRNGKLRFVPRELVPELDSVPAAILRSVAVSPAGDALSWRDVDVDVTVRGLLGCKRRSRRVDFNAGASDTT